MHREQLLKMITMSAVNANDVAETINGWRSVNTPVKFASVAYGNGVWVFTQTNSGIIYWSTDLVNFTAVNVGGSAGYVSMKVKFANGYFLRPAPNSSVLYYSTDGRTWNNTTGTTQAWNSCWGGGRWVLVDGYSGYISYSTATTPTSFSVTHALSSTGDSYPYQGIEYHKDSGLYIVSGNNLYTSANATSWTSRISSHWGGDVITDGSIILAGRLGTANQMARSTNGTSWSNVSLGQSGVYFGLAMVYAAGLFVAHATLTGLCIYSKDGVTWNSIPTITVSNAYWTGMAYGNRKFVVVGDGVNMGATMLIGTAA